MNIEVVELNTDELKTNEKSGEDSSIRLSNASVNFGDGVNLLMNDKRKSNTPKNTSEDSEIDMKELNRLEEELNDLSKTTTKSEANKSVLNSLPKIKSETKNKKNKIKNKKISRIKK